MKRWACLTIFLYACALLLLTAPAILIAFGNWGLKDDHASIKDASDIFAQWGYWVWLAVLAAGQFSLLLVPIDLSKRRLPARRKLMVPVIVTSFFLMNLFLAGLLSVLCAIFKDGGFEIFDLQGLFAQLTSPTAKFQPSDFMSVVNFCTPIILFWIGWAIIFFRATKADAPDTLIKRAVRWLLRGSILKLIVAVPSHVIVRRRDDCCAPLGTFWGIVTGISVMLLCFGPGVYFLFVERCWKLKPKSASQCDD